MNAIAKDAIPRPDWRVRRRRVEGALLLIRLNQWFEVDEITDRVWRGCEAGQTVEAIALAVADEFTLPLGEALAATAFTLRRFEALGLVQLPDAFSAPGSAAP